MRGVALTEDQGVAVARHGENVGLDAAARTKIERSRVRVERSRLAGAGLRALREAIEGGTQQQKKALPKALIAR